MGKWCLSRSRLRKRFTIFIQQTAGPRSSILSGLGLVFEDNSLKVNGVMSLLYKCPLYVFLARHKLHYLDYIAGNYEVEECLEDYQLSEDYSDSPVLSASPCGMTASGWVKHMATYLTYEIEREFTASWGAKLHRLGLSSEWYS